MLFGKFGDRQRIAIVKDGRRATIERLRWRGNPDLASAAEAFAGLCEIEQHHGDRDFYLAHFVAGWLDAEVVVPPGYEEARERLAPRPGELE